MIPHATTTISILKSDQDGTKDLRTPPTYSTLSTGTRAVIGAPAGSEQVGAGSQETVDWRLDADPCDLLHDDLVLDETTGVTYLVSWVSQRGGFGLDHTVAGLRVNTDRVSA